MNTLLRKYKFIFKKFKGTETSIENKVNKILEDLYIEDKFIAHTRLEIVGELDNKGAYSVILTILYN